MHEGLTDKRSQQMLFEVLFVQVQARLKYNVFYRCTVIVWMSLKFMMRLYFFLFWHRMWDEKTREKWNTLLYHMAVEYREKATKLGGVLIKVGQFLSTRTDMMPDVFVKEMAGLVDRVPPAPFSYAREAMETEWEGAIEDHFAKVMEKPIAAASIGQVYQGELHDGTVVAIKVRRYRVKEIFHIDFKALKIVFWLLRLFTTFGKKADLSTLYRELVFVMERELNFEQEVEFGKYFKERYKEHSSIYIPYYVESLCTEKILVMEWVTGAKITDISFMNEHHINRKQTALSLFDFYFDQFFYPGYFHADPHAGNILIKPDGKIVIIDFGMIGEIKKQDTRFFKKLIQGFIANDYDQILNVLDDMKFILPNADRDKLVNMMKQSLELYEDGSFNEMDSRMMEQIKEDVRMFIKEQPVNLSADYAYLGRAVSIVFGILISVYPDIDLGKLAKPRIKAWFGGKTFVETVYKDIAMDTVKPLLSFPKAMLEFLEDGEKDRKWRQEKHKIDLLHQFYVLVEMLLFFIAGGGVFTAVYANRAGMRTLETGSILVLIFFFFILICVVIKHYCMIRSK